MDADLYDKVTTVVERVAAFGGFGAVVGATAAAFRKSYDPDVMYGEWAAYCGAVTGIFGFAWTLIRLG
ncbi:MAG: hypothetical protein WBM00_08325 [Solirubrobacterales bacterium]